MSDGGSTPGVFELCPGGLTLGDLRSLAAPGMSMALAPYCIETIERTAARVDAIVLSGTPTYGVNTGVGTLSDRSIAAEDVAELQRRLVLSNAAGTGPLLPDRVVRWILALKINVLATGLSGVRREMVEALVALFNAGLIPAVPAKGSVGASGDLAPLAHVAAALIGEGQVRGEDSLEPAAAALERAGLAPYRLGAKEGLAMVNGTQVSLALALDGLLQAEAAFVAALVAGGLSCEAALGQAAAFDARIHAHRGQAGQIEVAGYLRNLLAGSEVRGLAEAEGRVQDPYCLRCQPQVMGTCLDFLRFATEILAREVNAATDNPLIEPESGAVLYGGNFHAEPVGMAADTLALAICEAGAMSERRTALLTDAHHSKLPAFLAGDSGLDSGFMVAQVTAAALASENKHLANAAATDSIPTTGNHEDFVSMATHAARRLADMADNLAGIVAIELLAACQGLEHRRPARSSDALERAHAKVRERVPPLDQDRFFAADLEAVKTLVQDGWFLDLLPDEARLVR